jgi:predicted nucleic acid-binding protein
VRYILDVNALIALGLIQHEFHQQIVTWVRRVAKNGIPELLTCSITELGFVRVLGQAQQYGFSLIQARDLLTRLKAGDRFRLNFIPDTHDISYLPKWVRLPKQMTDGHLIELARANDAMLATFDRGIPGGFLISTDR